MPPPQESHAASIFMLLRALFENAKAKHGSWIALRSHISRAMLVAYDWFSLRMRFIFEVPIGGRSQSCIGTLSQPRSHE